MMKHVARWLALLAAYSSVADGHGPKPVNSNYPGLTKVSSYLATQFETDNLLKSAQVH
jgi:hypothetical protein